MADRRMFSLGVIDTDGFGSMPLGAQALYFQLGMHADDDGFVKSPKLVQKMIAAPERYMRILDEAGYVIRFDSGVVVLTHWKLMNKIKADRYKPTLCVNEKALLMEDNTGRYTWIPEGCQTGSDPEPQGSPEKEKEEKENLTEGSTSAGELVARAYAEERNPYGKHNNVYLSNAEYAELRRTLPMLHSWIDVVSDYLADGNYGRLNHAQLIRDLAAKR